MESDITTGPIVRSIELPGHVKLPYVEQGDPSGVPVLLLHAIADSWRSFELVLSHLPESIHAFAPTQRGHGDAGRPERGYHPRDFGTDMAAFMDALHLQAAVIVRASSGGFVARRFAPCQHAACGSLSARIGFASLVGTLRP